MIALQRLTSLFAPSPAGRLVLAPEVVQTSAMDCGPAALKCLLEGFGTPVSYGRLREACQTDVDGTSIDTLEDVAVQLGLLAEQTMLPLDHLLLPEADALPALVVVVLPNGLTHFVVVWNCVGPLVQVMDPAIGRRWVSRQRFLREVYRHTLPFPAADWRAWAGGEGFCGPLRLRLRELRLDEPEITHLLDLAVADESWHSLSVLDAATRMVTAIVQGGGVARGSEASTLLVRFFEQTRSQAPDEQTIIPSGFWSVRPAPPSDLTPPETEQLLLSGAVLLRVQGRHASVAAAGDKDAIPSQPEKAEITGEATAGPLSPDLAAALAETPQQPEWEILRALRADGLLTPAVLAFTLFLATVGVTSEALLLRGLMGIGQQLTLYGERMTVLALIIAFSLILLLLEFPLVDTVMRMGRRLEVRLRMAFLDKVPRLGDRYFHSRLTSDMARRAHELRLLRTLPDLGVRFLRLAFQILLTAIGLLWLAPGSAPLALLAAIFAVGIVLLAQPALAERDLRLRTHAGALSRFYLDALLGLMPIRTHGAERAVRREHESLLTEWVRASRAFFDLDKLLQLTIALGSTCFAALLVFAYVRQGGEPSGVLLLLYWALNLPVLGQMLAELARQYPMQRNRVLTVLEPLGAPDESDKVTGWQGDKEQGARSREQGAGSERRGARSEEQGAGSKEQGTRFTHHASRITQHEVLSVPHNTLPVTLSPPHLVTLSGQGVAIQMEEVAVVAGGHTILHDISLAVRPGEHVAIVGPSGAGKSSLVGLLLGWHRPAQGHILVDGVPLTGDRLHDLRRVTAWVDPGVQLWNRSLAENLRYGANGVDLAAMSQVVDAADLYNVLERLPNGLQTSLGEGGGLVSGGEGQRVRLGRGLLRPGVRLVILDEPFRGLDRPKRRELLARARQLWADVTMLCITHDVGETQGFEHVLVFEAGQIVEVGVPQALASQSNSRYRALLDAEAAVREGMWAGAGWRRLWLENGVLQEGEQH